MDKKWVPLFYNFWVKCVSRDIEQSLVDSSLVQVVQTRLARIEKAMRKLEEGSYGLCEKCAQPIPFGRLRLVPEAETCGEKCAQG